MPLCHVFFHVKMHGRNPIVDKDLKQPQRTQVAIGLLYLSMYNGDDLAGM